MAYVKALERHPNAVVSKAKLKCAPCLHQLGYSTGNIAKRLRVQKQRVASHLKQSGVDLLGRRRPDKRGALKAWRVLDSERRKTASDIKAAAQFAPLKRLALALAQRHDAYRLGRVLQVADARRKQQLERLPLFRLKTRLRTFIWKLVKHPDVGRHWCGSLIGCEKVHKKCRRCLSLWMVGCTPAELRDHIAQRFEAGMNFENYGAWEVDHIKPCKLFDFRDEEQLRACMHYSNLQPMWKTLNRRKSASYQSSNG